MMMGWLYDPVVFLGLGVGAHSIRLVQSVPELVQRRFPSVVLTPVAPAAVAYADELQSMHVYNWENFSGVGLEEGRRGSKRNVQYEAAWDRCRNSRDGFFHRPVPPSAYNHIMLVESYALSSLVN